jgi:hypothetical protein
MLSEDWGSNPDDLWMYLSQVLIETQLSYHHNLDELDNDLNSIKAPIEDDEEEEEDQWEEGDEEELEHIIPGQEQPETETDRAKRVEKERQAMINFFTHNSQLLTWDPAVDPLPKRKPQTPSPPSSGSKKESKSKGKGKGKDTAGDGRWQGVGSCSGRGYRQVEKAIHISRD